MQGRVIVSTLDVIFTWIVKLAILNVLWFLFSFFGLFVAGVFPATAAALGVSRKWLMGDADIKIWMTFKQIYRREFVSSNMIGWFVTILGGFLYLDYQIINGWLGQLSFMIPFLFFFVLFFYLLIAIWSFPLLVHYKAHWFEYIRNAVIIGLTKIHYTLASFLIIFTVAYCSLSFPGIIPFFSVSLGTVGCMWLALQTFEKLESS